MIDNQVRICYAILDTSAQIADSHTRELVLELNFALDSVITPIVDTDIKKLLEYFEKYKLKNKHLDLFYLKKIMNMKTLKYHLPSSENHFKFLETLENLKNRK